MTRSLPLLTLVAIVLVGLGACLADPVRQPSQVELPDTDQRVTAGPAVRPKASPTATPKPSPTPSPAGSPTPSPSASPTPAASPSP